MTDSSGENSLETSPEIQARETQHDELILAAIARNADKVLEILGLDNAGLQLDLLHDLVRAQAETLHR